MFKTLLALSTLSLLTGCVVNQKYVNMPAKAQAKVRPLEWNPSVTTVGPAKLFSDIKLYRLDRAVLQQLAQTKQKKYLYACLYMYYCKPCWEKMTQVVQLQKANEQSVETVLIDIDNWADTPMVQRQLFSKQVLFPTFVLDEAAYGTEYRVTNRFNKLQQELAPNRPDLIGSPLNVILNSQLETLYASNKPMTQAILDSVMQARPQ